MKAKKAGTYMLKYTTLWCYILKIPLSEGRVMLKKVSWKKKPKRAPKMCFFVKKKKQKEAPKLDFFGGKKQKKPPKSGFFWTSSPPPPPQNEPRGTKSRPPTSWTYMAKIKFLGELTCANSNFLFDVSCLIPNFGKFPPLKINFFACKFN